MIRALRRHRALMRIEQRALQQQRGRAILTALLIAVPVAALVAAATLVHNAQPTPNQRARGVLGAADLEVSGYSTWDQRREIERIVASAPAAHAQTYELLEIFEGSELVLTDGARLRARLLAFEPATGTGGRFPELLAPRLHLLDGRAPRGGGEVALSPDLLRRLDADLGDRVTLSTGRPRVVVGSVVLHEATDQPLVVRGLAAAEYRGRYGLLGRGGVPAEALETMVQALRAADFSVTTRGEAAVADPAVTALVFTGAAFGLFQVALVIGAALSIGLRRRRVEFGQIGANGAQPRALIIALITSQSTVALLASLAGAATGLLAAAAVHPLLGRFVHRIVNGFEVPWSQCAVAVVLGTLTTAVATWLPARRAASLPIRQALAGRAPKSRADGRWVFGGAALLGLGVALVVLGASGSGVWPALAVTVGPICAIAGFGALSPGLLAALAGRVRTAPLAVRLAARDTARFRERNGAVVTAILAGMALSVTAAVLVESLQSTVDALPATLRSDHLLITGADADLAVTQLDALQPVAAAQLRAATVHGEPLRVDGVGLASNRRPWIAVADEALFEVLAVPGEHRDRFALLHLDGAPQREAAIEVTTWVTERALTMPPVITVRTGQRLSAPAWVVSQATAQALGLATGPPPSATLVPTLVRLPEPVDQALLARARQLAQPTTATFDAAVEQRSQIGTSWWWSVAAAVLVGLILVLVATALNAAESASDQRVLHTLGAAPELASLHLAVRSAYLALAGCLLAVPAGLLCARGLFNNASIPLDFVVPWGKLAIIVVALPLLVAALVRGTPARWWFAADPTGRRRQAAGAAAALTLLGLALPTPADAICDAGRDEGIAWQPRTLDGFGGRPIEGEVGRLCLPLRHDRPQTGERIELAFVRLRSSHPDPGPPIFFLAGGPGGSGIQGATTAATHPQLRLLEHGDVIGIDQRGVGESLPNLDNLAARLELPFDRPVTFADWRDATRTALQRSVRKATEQGVDLAAFTTEQSADDVDAVRRALGYDRIVLYGASYGSHLGLVHLRRHPGTVERAVLSRVEGFDDTWKLPSTGHAALLRLDDWFPPREDSDASISTRIVRLLGQLRTGRVSVHVEAGEESSAGEGRPAHTESITLGPWDLQLELIHRLGAVRDLETIPDLLDELEAGDWTALATASAAEDRVAPIPLMAWAMDCASGGSDSRMAEVNRQLGELEASSPILGPALLWPILPELCRELPRPNRAPTFHELAQPIDVPLLLVSGSLDPRTPPGNVERLRDRLPQSTWVRVRNAGHASRELMSRDYRFLLQAFLRAEPAPDLEVLLPRPLLRPEEDGITP